MLGGFATKREPLTNCGQGYSFFFDLIAQIWPSGNATPLHRICSLMRRMHAQSFLREELEPNAEIDAESAAATARCGSTVATRAIRLSFFRTCPSSLSWDDLGEEDFLGYVVILVQRLPDGSDRRFILEAVLRAPALELNGSLEPLANYYVHCSKQWQSTVGPSTKHRLFRVHGSFFCQQNDLTHVCAHAALRMAVNSSPIVNTKLTNAEINSILGIDHSTSRVGHYAGDAEGGLNADQIATIVQHLGFGATYANFERNPGVDYSEFLYPYIESACPVILGIERAQINANNTFAHAVAVLGHTMNPDRWTPIASAGYGSLPLISYHSSANWADHFIISDDNLGTYVTLPTDSIRNVLVPKYNPNLHASMAIALVPQQATIAGYLHEQSAARMTAALLALTTPAPGNRWLIRMKQEVFVCRTLLQEKNSYITAMAKATDSDGRSLDGSDVAKLQTELPDRFWITELSLPALYTANKSKLGDVVSRLDATGPEYMNSESIILAWLPGFVRSGPALSGPSTHWPISGHIPLLRLNNSAPPLLEW